MTTFHNPGWTNLQWNYVQALWTVPSGHTICSGTGAAGDLPWVGLGGDGWEGGSSNLIQGGTQTINNRPSPQVFFFWEDYPHGPNFLSPFNPPVAANDYVFVEVNYIGGSTTSFFFQDDNSSDWTSFDAGTDKVDLSSAEFISEDEPGSYQFVNYGSIPFQDASASGVWGSSDQYKIEKGLADNVTLTQFNSYLGTAQNQGPKSQGPGGIDSYGDFSVYSTNSDTC